MIVNEQEYTEPVRMLLALAKQQRRMQQLYDKDVVLNLFDMQRVGMGEVPPEGTQVIGYRYYLENDNKQRFSPVVREKVPLPEEEPRGYFFFSPDMSAAYMFSRIYDTAYSEAFYGTHTSAFNDDKHYVSYQVHGELEKPDLGWNTNRSSMGAGFVARNIAPTTVNNPISYMDKEDYDKVVEAMRILGPDKVGEDGTINI